MRTAAWIVAGFILLAVLFGIAHDLVTAHVWLPYFTVHHPRIVHSESPVVLALVWGVVATWWFGLIAGGLVALVNSRREVALPVSLLLKRATWTLLIMWIVSMALLVAIYQIATLIPLEKRRPTFEEDRRAVAVAVAHVASYWSAAIATVVLVEWTWIGRGPGRKRLNRSGEDPSRTGSASARSS